MEIGGYLEFEKYQGKEYHTGCLKLNTARNCLKYLIEARKIKKLWLSRFNCSAVIDTCLNSNIDLKYFELDSKLRPILPSEYRPEDYVYVVNYYGQLSDIKYEHMIWDNVQAFFEKPMRGVDTIYTCRKYFGVTDGAYLYTDAKFERELVRDESYTRINYLVARLEKSGSEFYSAYQENEKKLDSLPLMKMSAFTENILKSIDYESIRKRREENFYFLHEQLGRFNKLDVAMPTGPFAYPFMIDNGGVLRKQLQAEKVYVAKLWPNVTDEKERMIAENTLPLPCDHRYSRTHMQYIVELILNYLNGGKQ